jgi:NIPSNAP
MITAIRTYRPQPGKAFELMEALRTSVAHGAKACGMDLHIAMTVGGVVGEISVISNYNDLDHMEELIDKAMGHAEWRAANAKVHGLCISGEARDHIFRHV